MRKSTIPVPPFNPRVMQQVTIKRGRLACVYDWKMSRPWKLVILMIVTCVPVILLIIENSIKMNKTIISTNISNDLRRSIRMAISRGNLINRLQIERGLTVMYIGSEGESSVFRSLWQAYAQTDRALSEITVWPSIDLEHFQSRETFKRNTDQYRAQFDVQTADIFEVMEHYSNDIEQLMSGTADKIIQSSGGRYWTELVAYHMLLFSKEYAGRERAIGSFFFTNGGLDRTKFEWAVEITVKTAAYLKNSLTYSTTITKLLSTLYYNSAVESSIHDMRHFLQANDTSPSVADAHYWFKNMSLYIDILSKCQDRLSNDMLVHMDADLAEITRGYITNIAILSCMVLLLPVVMYLVHRLTHDLATYMRQLRDRTHDLEVERLRSECLLHQMLPPSVARKLMDNEPVEPEEFEVASVFFSDIVDFTVISSGSTPRQIITMLDMLYDAMDKRLEHYDVYKIETIGDAYFVASGIPIRNGDKHSLEIGQLALDIKATVMDMTVPHMPLLSIKLRIGMNSDDCQIYLPFDNSNDTSSVTNYLSECLRTVRKWMSNDDQTKFIIIDRPVMAGVVGHTMPRYCLFGDTINTASRMESSGLPLRIHITERSKFELEKHSIFYISERGIVNIKGKGIMKTYWLDGMHVNLGGLVNSEVCNDTRNMSSC